MRPHLEFDPELNLYVLELQPKYRKELQLEYLGRVGSIVMSFSTSEVRLSLIMSAHLSLIAIGL